MPINSLPGSPQNPGLVNTNPSVTPVPVVPSQVEAITGEVVKTPRKWPKILAIIVVVVLVLLVAMGGAASAIAYGVVKINNPALEQSVSQFVMSLPFTPKTPKFLLESAALAHSKISRHSFNVSLAAQSQDFVSTLGFAQIDIEAKGSVDYSDTKNLLTSLNISITKDFNADIRKKDTYVYLKINKVPGFLTTLLKIDQAKLVPVLENWIGYDTQPLQTEARKVLDKDSEQKSLTKEYINNLVDDLLDEKLLPALSSSNELLEGHETTKVHLTADNQTIDTFVNKIMDRLAGDQETKQPDLKASTEKPSDYIKDLAMDLWIDQNSHFIRKVATSFKFNPNFNPDKLPSRVLGVSSVLDGRQVLGAESSLYTLGKSESSIVTVIKFDNFGEQFMVETPTKYLKPEEFANLALATSETYASAGGGPVELVKRSRDAARLSDMANLQQAINISLQERESGNELSALCSSGTFYCMGSSVSGGRAADGKGWVKVILNHTKAVSVPALPIDPVNDQEFHYVYCANKDGWEMNTVLESAQQKPKMGSDGGDNENRYEVGANLILIDKVPGCRY